MKQLTKLAVLVALISLAVISARGEALAAARSVHVIIKNDSDRSLVFAQGKTQHGIVTRKPPTRMGPGGVGELFAESNGVATGTEGWVKYKIEGAPGDVQFNWDNPFVGSNSAGGSAPAGYRVEHIGDKGNRTLVFFSFHHADRPVASCNADWVINHLGHKAEEGLDTVDEVIGFVTTPAKRLGFGGWVDTGCRAQAEGWPVRDAQGSSDKFWTVDVRLHSFKIGSRQLKSGIQRFVRLEVEPGTPAHGSARAKKNQFIRVEGVVLIDTHHGDELIEIHPHDPIVAAKPPGR